MNTTITIRKSTTTPTGYEILDNDKILPIVAYDPANKGILKLPENSSNRKWFSISKIGESIDLDYKASKVIGPRDSFSPKSPKKPDEDFLNQEDKILYLSLKEKIRKAREEANKKVPMTELEKARLQVERANKKVADLEKKALENLGDLE